jgi:Ran GTPase-activating protein 1
MFLSSGIGSPTFASPTFIATQNNKPGKTLRAKLLSFFKQNAPSKAATVDILIEKFKDKDASDLVSQLESKYNVKMADINNNNSAATTMVGKKSPLGSFTFNSNTNILSPSTFYSSFGHVPPQSSLPSSGTAKAATVVVPPSKTSLRNRLTDFLLRNNASDKIVSVDILLEKFKGKDNELFEKLQSKYERSNDANNNNPSNKQTVVTPANNINVPQSIPYFDLEGKRELLTKERAIELFQIITKDNAHTVEKIRLSSKSFDSASAEVAAAKLRLMKNLRYADLSDIIAGRETSIGLKVLSIFSKALVETPLLWVDLSDNALGPRGVNVCEPLLSSSGTLEGIAFRNDGLSKEACYEIKRLFLKLSSPTRLKKLLFWNNMSGDGGGEAIAELLIQSPFMEDFQLSTTRCGEKGGTALCAAFKHCSMLQKLDISDNTFNVAGAVELSKSLRSLPRMVELNIGDLNFKDEGVAHLLKALVQPVCPVLEILDISLNDISDESLKFLPDALAGKKQFKRLVVKGNYDLGNKGCVIIAKTFTAAGFTSNLLEEIDLQECDVHDRGASFLATSLVPSIQTRHKNFKLLNLDDNRISDSVSATIQDKFSAIGNNALEVKIDEQDEDDEYESDCDDIDLTSISKTIAEIYSPVASPTSSNAAPVFSVKNDFGNNNIGKTSIRQRVYDFFKVNGPSRLDTIDILLEKYNNNETQLITDLENKYKTTFNVNTINNHLPQKGNRPRILQSLQEEMYEPSEEKQKIAVSQPDESESIVGNFRSQLITFYERNAPEKIGSIDILLAKFKGKEDNLRAELETKYNSKLGSTDHLVSQTLRLQLLHFFMRHNPEKMNTIDILIEKNNLDPSDLMKKLRSKYNVSSRVDKIVDSPKINFSTKMGVFDLGNVGEDETISLDMIHERLQLHLQKNVLDIGSISLNDKSLDVDAMEVLARKVSDMENLHTARLRNMTHGRDPAEGLGGKACNILVSALSSKKLKMLDISSNMLGSSAGKVWAPLLSSQPYVEELILEASHKFRHGYKADACNDLLEKFAPKNLRKLVLVNHADNEDDNGDAVACAFSSLVAQSPLLEYFCYKTNCCGSNGGIQLSKALEPCGKNLTFLDLSDNYFRAEGGIALSAAISGMAVLKTLKLDDMGLEDEGISSLLNEVCNACPNLETLSLKYNDATSEGIENLNSALGNKSHLRELRLGGNLIEQKGCLIVRKTLSNLKKLTVLDMQECGLRNNDTISLCDDIIELFENISKVDLDGNNLTDIGVTVVTNKLADAFGDDSVGSFECNDPPMDEDTTDELDKINNEILKMYGTEREIIMSSHDDYNNDEEKTGVSSSINPKNAFAAFAIQAGQWKCGVCMITNEGSKPKCVACESPNPDATKADEGHAKPQTATSNITFGSNTSGGGFSFGGAPKIKETKAVKSSIGSGFSFGGGPKVEEAKAVETSNGGGFSFGSAPKVEETKPVKSSNGGGFSFGSAPKVEETKAEENSIGGGFSFGSVPKVEEAKAVETSNGGGFSFGSVSKVEETKPVKASSGGGFSFGGGPKVEETKAEENSIGGSFSFGGAPKVEETKPVETSSGGGFSFGGAPKVEDSKAEENTNGGGFSFGRVPKVEETKPVGTSNGGSFSFGGAPKVEETKPVETTSGGGFSFGGAPKVEDIKAEESSNSGGFSFGGAPKVEETRPVKASNGSGISFGGGTKVEGATLSTFGSTNTTSNTNGGFSFGVGTPNTESQEGKTAAQAFTNGNKGITVEVSKASVSYGNFSSFMEKDDSEISNEGKEGKTNRNLDKPIFAFASPEKNLAEVAQKIEASKSTLAVNIIAETPSPEKSKISSITGAGIKSQVSYGDFSAHFTATAETVDNSNKKEPHHALGAKIFDFNADGDTSGSQSTKSNFRKEVVAFFEKHAPHKLDTVDFIVEMHKDGEEDKIWEKIKKHYGPGSLLASQRGSSPALSQLYKAGTPGRYGNGGGETPGLRLSNLSALNSPVGRESSPIIVVSSPSTLAVSGPRIINPPWQNSLHEVDSEIFEKDIRVTTSWWRRRPRGERRATVTQALRLWSKSKSVPPTVSIHDHSFRTDTKFSAKKFLKQTRLMISSTNDVYVGSVILETANRSGNLKSLLPKWGITMLNC